jgi:hypothetical protein
MTEAPSELDRLALGPDAAYAEAEPRPRPPRRHIGEHEKGVRFTLSQFPAALRKGALAVTALGLARDMDTVTMTPRDKAGHAAQLRQHINDLTAQAPGERKGDVTDEVRARRESRMLAAGE